MSNFERVKAYYDFVKSYPRRDGSPLIVDIPGVGEAVAITPHGGMKVSHPERGECVVLNFKKFHQDADLLDRAVDVELYANGESFVARLTPEWTLRAA